MFLVQLKISVYFLLIPITKTYEQTIKINTVLYINYYS